MNEPLRKAWDNRCHFEFADRFLPANSESMAAKRNLLKQFEKLEGTTPSGQISVRRCLIDTHSLQRSNFSETQLGVQLKKPRAR